MWGDARALQGLPQPARLTLPEATLIYFSFTHGRTKVSPGPLFQLGVYL